MENNEQLDQELEDALQQCGHLGDDFDRDSPEDHAQSEWKQEVANDDRALDPPALVLTEEQQQAVARIMAWTKNASSGEYKLGGYAGTGKTTVIKTILEQLRKTHDVVVAAFTGKAVNVLQRKGIRAQTLHSLMYDCEKVKGVLHWYKKTTLCEGACQVVIVDEASMISTELYNDLRSYNKLLLFVGDPGQLEPVGDNPNLMAQPDFVLSKIHRQAAQSPIITLANNIRTGQPMPPFQETAELVIRGKVGYDVRSVTQLICAKNKTRRMLNEQMRRLLTLEPRTLTVGEKIIVLKNNRALGVFNGVILFVKELVRDVPVALNVPPHWVVNAEDETGKAFNELPIWKHPFESDQEMPKNVEVPRYKVDNERVELCYADYGYVVTCHKSQGSEWDTVLVYDEYMPPHIWDMKRWRYTSITRASKKLIYCL